MNELTIIEQLALIAQSAKAEFQTALMWACLAVLAAGVLAGILYAARHAVLRLCRSIASLGPFGCAIVIPCVVAVYVYGSTKWRFEYVNGVHDNGSYCTNNQICAAWTYDLPAMEYTIKAAYQDLTITNELGVCVDPLHQLLDAMVRDGSHVWEVSDATNMRVVVYATYVPPPAVHTNGVYHLNGVMPSMDETLGKYVTPGVKIIIDTGTGDRKILTPTNAPPQPITNALQTQQENNQ